MKDFWVWPKSKLGKLASFRNGLNFTKDNFGSGVKVIGVSDFQDYLRPRYSELDEINPDGVVKDQDLLRDKDIVFVRSNGNRELIGRSLYVENLREPISHSGFTIRLRFLSQEVIPLFYAYLFRTPIIRHALSSHGGGTNISNLSQEILGALEVPVPCLKTQRRIAGILSTYDDLIENCQRRIRVLEDMARGLYREWFVHFRFPGADNLPRVNSSLGLIPQGWSVRSFTDVAHVMSGGTPKTGNPDYWGGEIPFFTPRDAPRFFFVHNTEKRLSEQGLLNCASELYPHETVFITARGTVGKVALAGVEMAMNQSCYALRGKPGFGQRYIFLLTLQQVDYLKKNTGGSTFDTIVVDTFRRMMIAVPEPELVLNFTNRIDGLFDQINLLQKKVLNLRCTRDLLLPRLMSGQIRPEAAEEALDTAPAP